MSCDEKAIYGFEVVTNIPHATQDLPSDLGTTNEVVGNIHKEVIGG